MAVPWIAGILLGILAAVLFVTRGRVAPLRRIINVPMFVLGILIAGVAALLLVFNVIESGVAALIGIIGISLIAASGTPARSPQP